MGRLIGGCDGLIKAGPYSGTATSGAPLGSPAEMRKWHTARRKYLKSLKPTTFAGGTWWLDFAQGSDSNDGLDGLGFGLSGATWAPSTLTLTKTNAFTSYTPMTGDQIYITGGTGISAGLYTVASKTSNSAIVLTSSIGASAAIDVTSSSGPWLTFDKLRTASKLSVSGIRIKVAQGKDRVYRYTAASNGNSATGDATAWLFTGAGIVVETYYPTNKTPLGSSNPRITCFSLIAAASWTLSSASTGLGATYKFTTSGINAVYSVRPNGCNTVAMSKQTSEANCLTRDASFFHDGANTLYALMPGGSDPTSGGSGSVTLYEYVKGTNGAVACNGIGFESGTGYVWWDGVDVDGFGVSGSASAYYAVHGYGAGSDTLVVMNCDLTYSSKHNLGHTSAGTGGILLCENVNCGWCSNAGADTPFVSYAGTGSNQFYSYNCGVFGGKQPVGLSCLDGGGVCGSDMFTSHNTDNTTTQAMCVIEKMFHHPSQYPCGGLGGVQHSASIDTDERLCTAYFLDCEYRARTKGRIDDKTSLWATGAGTDTIGKCPYAPAQGCRNDGAHPPTWSTWYDGCYWESRPLWAPPDQLAAASAGFKGFFTNCTFIVDGRHCPGLNANALYALGLLYSGGNTEINARLQNCHVHTLVGPGRAAGMVTIIVVTDSAADTPGGAGSNQDSRLQVYDSIVTYEGSRDGVWFLGVNPATAANIVSNAWGTGTVKGFTAAGVEISGLVRKDWRPGQVPVVGDIDCTPTALPSGNYLRSDSKGLARRAGSTAIGPVEASTA